MKIAILQRFLPESSRGGVGYFTHGLANVLVARGHQVTVFTQDPRPSNASYEIVNIGNKLKKSKWDVLKFPFELSRCDFSSFDVIHAQGDEQWIPRQQNLPVIRTLHGSSWVEAYYNGIQRLSLKHFLLHFYFYLNELVSNWRADYVTAVSQDTKRYYPRVHEIIGNGIDLDIFSSKQIAKASHPVILFVGELYSRKRGDLLLKVFSKEIKSRLPTCELWLVCPEKIQESGVRTFTALNEASLAELYQKAWVFCLPSSYEGFGRPYVEAMAAGTAVLATTNPGACEILENGKYGILVPPKKLGQSLYDLLTDDVFRQSFASRGFVRAQDFSWDAIAARYETIYLKLFQDRCKV